MAIRIVKAIFILAFAVALILLQWIQFDTARRHSSTSFSNEALGTSAFLEIMQRFAPEKVSLLRHAIYNEEDLGGEGTLLIISSPLGEISLREAGIIRAFVEKGGWILLSCHQESCQQNVFRISQELSASFSTSRNQSYIAGQSEEISIQNSELFPPGTYNFYSAQIFNTFEFEANQSGTKFTRELNLGRGRIFLISSVIPLANGLINRGDNSKLLGNILSKANKIIFDEYHHLFSEKNLGDLILTPWVSLPMTGLILAALAFFLFGEAPLTFKHPSTFAAPSFHRFNQDTLRGLLQNKAAYAQARELQHRVILRTNLKHRPDISGATIMQLARIHRNYLRIKRGK